MDFTLKLRMRCETPRSRVTLMAQAQNLLCRSVYLTRPTAGKQRESIALIPGAGAIPEGSYIVPAWVWFVVDFCLKGIQRTTPRGAAVDFSQQAFKAYACKHRDPLSRCCLPRPCLPTLDGSEHVGGHGINVAVTKCERGRANKALYGFYAPSLLVVTLAPGAANLHQAKCRTSSA